MGVTPPPPRRATTTGGPASGMPLPRPTPQPLRPQPQRQRANRGASRGERSRRHPRHPVLAALAITTVAAVAFLVISPSGGEEPAPTGDNFGDWHQLAVSSALKVHDAAADVARYRDIDSFGIRVELSIIQMTSAQRSFERIATSNSGEKRTAAQGAAAAVGEAIAAARDFRSAVAAVKVSTAQAAEARIDVAIANLEQQVAAWNAA